MLYSTVWLASSSYCISSVLILPYLHPHATIYLASSYCSYYCICVLIGGRGVRGIASEATETVVSNSRQVSSYYICAIIPLCVLLLLYTVANWRRTRMRLCTRSPPCTSSARISARAYKSTTARSSHRCFRTSKSRN